MSRPAATILIALASAALVLVFAEGLAAAAPERTWQLPVTAAAARIFDLAGDPFEAGRHRGLDLAGGPGARVRAPCPGRVTFAGRVARQGSVVSVRCGPWLVSALPLRSVAVRRGGAVARGQPLGRLGAHPGHAGLHVGVRRAGSHRAYVDPAPFFGVAGAPPPLVGPVRARRPRGSRPFPRFGPAPVPRVRPVRVPTSRPERLPEPRLAHRRSTPPEGVPGGAAPSLAPWPAWAGLALVLAGAAGTGRMRWRARRRDGVPAPTTEVASSRR